MDIDHDLVTRWMNPTEHHFKFRIFMGPGQHRRVSVKPGEEIELPSEYDDAIQHRAKGSNVVTGGLCPLLRKVDAAPPEIAPALLGIEKSLPAPTAKEVDSAITAAVATAEQKRAGQGQKPKPSQPSEA